MTLSKLALVALTALVTLPLSACAVAPEGSDGNGERSAEGCPTCVPQTDKIVHSEWSTWQIKVHDIETGANTTLPLYGRHPVFNANQSKIAFAGLDGNIYIANASDGSGKVKLTTAGTFDSPAFSPDKNTIVYASVGIAGSGADIYKIAATGGSATRLTANGSDWYFAPQFLDADTVVFQVGLDGSARFGLVPITAVHQSSFEYLAGVPTGYGDLSVGPGGAHVALTKEGGSCGSEAISVGGLNGHTVNNLHEIICTPGFNSSSPSIGGGGVIAFEWGAYAKAVHAYTIPLAGGMATSQGISSPDGIMDLSMR